MQEQITRPTIMEVNIKSFNTNVKEVKKKLSSNTQIMPIMKANAYGTYLNTRLDVINQFSIIGVAIVDEGVELRKLGYKKDIFILNQPSINEIPKIIENNLIIGLSSKTFLREAKNNFRKNASTFGNRNRNGEIRHTSERPS